MKKLSCSRKSGRRKWWFDPTYVHDRGEELKAEEPISKLLISNSVSAQVKWMNKTKTKTKTGRARKVSCCQPRSREREVWRRLRKRNFLTPRRKRHTASPCRRWQGLSFTPKSCSVGLRACVLRQVLLLYFLSSVSILGHHLCPFLPFLPSWI